MKRVWHRHVNRCPVLTRFEPIHVHAQSQRNRQRRGFRRWHQPRLICRYLGHLERLRATGPHRVHLCFRRRRAANMAEPRGFLGAGPRIADLGHESVVGARNPRLNRRGGARQALAYGVAHAALPWKIMVTVTFLGIFRNRRRVARCSRARDVDARRFDLLSVFARKQV